MGYRMINGGAIFCCVASIVLVIAAAVTTEWMTACMPIDAVLSSMSNMIPDMGDAVVKGASDMLNGNKICVNQGLFRMSFDMAGMMKADSPIDASSLPVYAIITSLALVVVLICVIVAAALLIAASSGKSDQYEGKPWASRRFTAASVMLGIAAVVTIGGMAVYTGATAKMIHQPLQYLAQFETGAMSSLPNIFGGNDRPSMPSAYNHGLPSFGNPGRKRRDLDLGDLGDLSNINALGDLGNSNGLGDLGNINSLGDLGDINGILDSNGVATKNMLNKVDPKYGYSSILGWVSLVFTILALCLSVAGKQSLLQHPYQAVQNV